jgi:hypothetical protein
MMQNPTIKTKEYQLDLSKTDRNGAFHCPKCKTKISPDDNSENVYSIYEAKTAKDNLSELVLYCKRCCSLIHLRGFSGLPKTGNTHSFKGTKNKSKAHAVAPLSPNF